jgi:drug/metabolite transporter (DMT)-like permease
MSWIVFDLLVFVSSVLLYLTIRKSTIYKLPTQFNNLGIFLIPVFFFNAANLISHSNKISASHLLIIILAGIFLSYGSSIFSLKSIELAPNPGYSLIISKNYVLMTSFLAIPLFHQTLSMRGLFAIILIIFFSSLIVLHGKSKNKASSNAWFPLALGAFFGWGLLSLMAKYLYLHGVAPITFLAYLSLVATICIFIEMYLKKVSLKPFKSHPWIFVTIGLSSTAFNFFNFYTIKVAPNVGYVNATNAASIGVITLFAALLFKDELNARKLIGVTGTILSLVLLFTK